MHVHVFYGDEWDGLFRDLHAGIIFIEPGHKAKAIRSIGLYLLGEEGSSSLPQMFASPASIPYM